MENTEQSSFTQIVKNELSYKKRKPKERVSVFLGIMVCSKINSKGEYEIESEIISVMNLVLMILQKEFGYEAKIIHEKKNKITKNIIHQIILPKDIYQKFPFYKDLSEENYDKLFEKYIPNSIICGVFLKTGTINDPENGNYYLGITIPNEKLIETINSEFDKLEGDRQIQFKHFVRRNHDILYLKKSLQIGNFLAYINAITAMLNYENIRLTRDYNNNDNRVTICYSANYEKALKNGINNIKDIKIVEKCYGLQNFSERDLKIFEMRLDHADSSYTELSEIAAKNNITISRSTIVKIFSDLKKLADKCRLHYPNVENEIKIELKTTLMDEE